MSWPKYPEYKPSGVQWIRDVPGHWDVRNPKTLFMRHREPAHESDRQLTASQADGVVYQDEYMESRGAMLVQVIEGQAGLKHVSAGDFVISLRSFQGGIEWSGVAGKISPAYTVLTSRPEVIQRYFVHLLKTDGFIQELRSTSNQLRDGQSLGLEHFAQVPVPLPPAAEQRAIAQFLDHETGKIDALIAKHEQLVATLREERDTTIHHAVICGLDPSAPVKDVRVGGWALKIPAGWEVRRLKSYGRLVIGRTPPTENQGNFSADGFPWVRPQDIDPHTGVTIPSAGLSSEGLVSANRLPSGTVLVCSIGMSTGKIGHIRHAASTNQQITAIVGSPSPRYLFYLLTAFGGMIRSFAAFNRMPIINNERLGSIKLPCPPVAEMGKIADYLDARTSAIDRLIAKTHATVGILNEYRSALIVDAVTGAIDVRR